VENSKRVHRVSGQLYRWSHALEARCERMLWWYLASVAEQVSEIPTVLSGPPANDHLKEKKE